MLISPSPKAPTFFTSGNYKGSKFVKALPEAERAAIEKLKPYQGGNDLLYTLHSLDVIRKHKRVLTVEVKPSTLNVTGWGLSKYFTPISTGWMRSGDDETVIGILAKGAPKPQINLTMQVSFSEASYVKHRRIDVALNDFAGLAKAIIRLFDVP